MTSSGVSLDNGVWNLPIDPYHVDTSVVTPNPADGPLTDVIKRTDDADMHFRLYRDKTGVQRLVYEESAGSDDERMKLTYDIYEVDDITQIDYTTHRQTVEIAPTYPLLHEAVEHLTDDEAFLLEQIRHRQHRDYRKFRELMDQPLAENPDKYTDAAKLANMLVGDRFTKNGHEDYTFSADDPEGLRTFNCALCVVTMAAYKHM